jgi:hypothetical protein
VAIDAVERPTRYLERIRLDPAMAGCRGVLAAQVVRPPARVLAEARDIGLDRDARSISRSCASEREPDLTLLSRSHRALRRYATPLRKGWRDTGKDLGGTPERRR